MKKAFISEIKKRENGRSVEVYAWVKSKRKHAKIIFIDLVDSSGEIQAIVVANHDNENVFQICQKVRIESAVKVIGIIEKNKQDKNEIHINELNVISKSTYNINPHPREDFDIFDDRYTDLVLRNRHLFIRNPKLIAILKYRSKMLNFVQNWFHENNFHEFHAPILTQTVLYDNNTALGINVHGDDMFLTQCAGYYLEAGAHALERVYNIGPSFRGEESRSKRHLMEYYHIKAEAVFWDLEDIITLVEDLICKLCYFTENLSSDICEVIGKKPNIDGKKIPFPRIWYKEAIRWLQKKRYKIEFGEGLGSFEEEALSKMFKSPFWVSGIPRSIEPFPYCIDKNDTEVTVTADLILNNGYGELLGVAEKIYDSVELIERMKEKKKYGLENYQWILDVHNFGCVPHAAFGMGLERAIRWLLNIPHVRDATPFPRVFKRTPYP